MSSRIIFSWMWNVFDTLFWLLFTLARASGFSDMLQPFHSKTRFSKVRGHYFLYIFSMFCDFSSSFFLPHFLGLFMSFAIPFAIILQKKTVPKIASKRGAPQHVNMELWTSPEAPRETASRAHFSNKKQQFELKTLVELVSIAFSFQQLLGNATWICFNFKCFKWMSKAHC